MGRFTQSVQLVCESFCPGLGLLAAGWGGINFSASWQQSTAQKIALRVIERESFNREALASELFSANLGEREHSFCNPVALRGAAFIQLRIAEQAMANRGRSRIDRGLSDAQTAARRSLACRNRTVGTASMAALNVRFR